MIDLSNNTNPYGMSIKTYWEYIKAGLRYGHTYDNFQELMKNELQHYYLELYGVELLVSNFAVTAGITQAINIISRTLNKDDEVILSEPTYLGYESAVKKVGATIRKKALKSDNHQDFNGILKLINRKTKIIFICNPNNPTGVFEREKLYAFLNEVPEKILVVVDEAYIDYVIDGESFSAINMLHQKKNIIILRSFSKIYGLAGLRLGYVISSEEVIMKLRGIGGYYMSVTAPSIMAGISALRDRKRCLKIQKRNIRERNIIIEKLKKYNIMCCDSDTNFIYCITQINKFELYNSLLERHIAINDEYPNLRITIGSKKQNKKLLLEIGGIIKDNERV